MRTTTFLLTVAILFVTASAFAQVARINGVPGNSSLSVCEGSTFTLTASISTGDLVGDTYVWYEQVNGGTPDTVSTAATFTAPIDEPGTAEKDTSYFYTLVITRGGSNYYAFVTVLVNPKPTVGSVSVVNTPCGGAVEVTVNGLGTTFPLTVKLYASSSAVDDYSTAVLVSTKTNVTTPTTTITGTIPTGGVPRHLYLLIQNPSTGCLITK